LSGKFNYAYFSSDVKGEVHPQCGKYMGRGLEVLLFPFFNLSTR